MKKQKQKMKQKTEPVQSTTIQSIDLKKHLKDILRFTSKSVWNASVKFRKQSLNS